jgi:hypothetical protein
LGHYRKKSQGKLIEVEETLYGFKLLALYEVRLRQVVAVKVAAINPHDSNFTLELVKQAQRNLGKERLKVLLIDRGFLAGEALWQLIAAYGLCGAGQEQHAYCSGCTFIEQ